MEMVTKRKGIVHILLLVLIVVLISLDYASAITGKIGNGKMILNAEVGDVIERSILVINDNDVVVNITVSASGGLEKDAKIIDKNFILQPGEEKKAEFTIKIKKPGTNTTRINVQFSPMNVNKSGVGLSSQVITHAFGKGELPEEEETNSEEKSESEDKLTGSIVKEEDSQSSKVFIMMGVVSIVLLVVLVFLLSFLSKKKFGTKNKTDEINQADTDSKKKTNKERVK